MITKIDPKKLKSLSKNSGFRGGVKSVSQNYKSSENNSSLLDRCMQDFSAMAYIRSNRERNIRYRNGDQWSDYVVDPDDPKSMVKEEVLISRSGRFPHKHNFIQQFIRSIHAPLLSSPRKTIVSARTEDDHMLGNMLTNVLQACHQLNQVNKLDINVIEELCLSGIVCAKVRFDYWSVKNRTDGKLDLVNVNRLFFNQDIEDPRLFDLRRVGELHDYTYDDLLRNFAESKADAKALNDIYGMSGEYTKSLETSNSNYDKKLQNTNFYVCQDPSKYRVIEVWEKLGRWVLYTHDYADGSEDTFTDVKMEDIEAINKDRITQGLNIGLSEDQIQLIFAERKYEYYWSVKYLTPNGYCLKEMETPYIHEEHPYSIATMTLLDGRFQPVLSDVIDIQRYINRLISMLDFIIGSSAKNLLLVPEECIPEHMDINDFADEYTKANGVILIKSNAMDKIPKQISQNSTNIGAWEMLNMQMNIMNQISGISGAMQGQQAKSNTPSSLYAQEAQNSLSNFKLLYEIYNMYCEDRDTKLLKVQMQYIDTPRYLDINGEEYDETAKKYEPEMVDKIIDFNLVTTKSVDTPVFRQAADDILMKLLESSAIDLKTFLENSSLPFKDKLLNSINNAQGQVDANMLDPNVLAQQGVNPQDIPQANPQAMQMMQQYIS